MKHRVQAYFLTIIAITLIFIIIFGVGGSGYVSIYWWHWQLQSSVLVLGVLLFAFVSALFLLVSFCLWQWRKAQSKKRHLQFSQLYLYEQSGLILFFQSFTHHTSPALFASIVKKYQTSPHLSALIQSVHFSEQKQYDVALQVLHAVPSHLQALAELQTAHIYLLQQHEQKSLQQLSILTAQLAHELEAIQPLYQQVKQHLWAKFAQQFAVAYLDYAHHHTLNAEQFQQWLNALILVMDLNPQTTVSIIQNKLNIIHDGFKQYDMQYYGLNQRYLILLQQLFKHTQNMQINIFLREIAEQSLNYYFDEYILLLWLHSMQEQGEHQGDIQAHLSAWQQQYQAMPCLTFAQLLLQPSISYHHLQQFIQDYPHYHLTDVLQQYSQHRQVDEHIATVELMQLWS
ncbi:MAG: hypothetical protein Q4D05_04035, partial [Acinetobacter sp.]|nr:hypothetical protein [Acinetobacter sp.]